MRGEGSGSIVGIRTGATALCTMLACLAAVPVAGQDQARGTVARALDLMGGEAVRAVERVRLDTMTQWQRTAYRDVPWTDRPSFEPHTDVRDYTIPAWRNTRDFGAQRIVNVVRDTVATTDMGDGPRPQSVAYVDERDELFMYTPDRLMLILDGAADLRAARDTVVGGERFTQVQATLRGDEPVTVAFHAGTGLPALLRFRAAHPNDFGLVPFGEMHVEVWYSAWRTFGAVSIPTQWDVQRAGAPYKRMTVRAADFDPDFAADSFHVAPELRAAFLQARGPMHDRPVDSVSVMGDGVARVHGFGFPEGALRLGNGWVLLEAGHAPLSFERGSAALADAGVSDLEAAIVAAARPGNGGVATLVEAGVPVYTSVAAAPFVDAVLRGAAVRARGVTVVREPTELRRGGRLLRLEPVDLPDVPGSLVVWAPDDGVLYAPDALTPLDVRMVRALAGARGWSVRQLWTARGPERP